MFHNSLNELCKYFIETHNETGERKTNGYEQEEQPAKLPEINNSLKILSGVFNSFAIDKELVERECVTDMETTFRQFLIVATEYLKDVRVKHQNAIKNKSIQQAIASISNIKYTHKLLSIDQFHQTLN